VHAAGGVVWRRGDDGVEVAVVHRPRYDDWSLPKGKLDPGESFEEAALREVLEEIGARVDLGDELPPTTYRDHKGRLKLVRYWLMEARDVAFEPNDEVDDLRWLAVGEAVPLLSYERDRALLDHAAGMLS
jgi:8-oxo-dGTP pyrophosphatase MutT (NUDIX family)